MISLSLTLEREYDDYVTLCYHTTIKSIMVPSAPKFKVITYDIYISYYHLSYRRKSVPNLLVEIQNTFVPSFVRDSSLLLSS